LGWRDISRTCGLGRCSHADVEFSPPGCGLIVNPPLPCVIIEIIGANIAIVVVELDIRELIEIEKPV